MKFSSEQYPGLSIVYATSEIRIRDCEDAPPAVSGISYGFVFFHGVMVTLSMN